MSKYNGLFSAAFHGCMIVGKLHDEGRGRDVTLYAIRDDPEVVGYYDGIDTWVGSTSTCSSKTVREELAAVHAGESREIEYGQTRRRLHDMPGSMGRPQLELMNQAPRPRKRAMAPSDGSGAPNPPPVARQRVVGTIVSTLTLNGQQIGESMSHPIIDNGVNRMVKERRRAQQ